MNEPSNFATDLCEAGGAPPLPPSARPKRARRLHAARSARVQARQHMLVL